VIDHLELIRAVRDFVRALPQSYDVGPMLYRLADQAVEVLGVDGAGVSLEQDGMLVFVAATDADVRAVEERQLETGAGPCHDAFHAGKPVSVTDLTLEDRWEAYRRTAAERGIRAVVGMPMGTDDRVIGAFNAYRREPHDWAADELDLLELFAEMASGYIFNAAELHRIRNRSDDLQRALDSRVIIEQAVGVLAERHRLEPSDAFQRLRAHARGTNSRLHDLAHQVVHDDEDVPA
jgi:GAF domain-containing protein